MDNLKQKAQAKLEEDREESFIEEIKYRLKNIEDYKEAIERVENEIKELEKGNKVISVKALGGSIF